MNTPTHTSTGFYVVAYGDNTGEQVCPTWREASAYIKHCLDSGTRVREVRKQRANISVRFVSKSYSEQMGKV